MYHEAPTPSDLTFFIFCSIFCTNPNTDTSEFLPCFSMILNWFWKLVSSFMMLSELFSNEVLVKQERKAKIIYDICYWNSGHHEKFLKHHDLMPRIWLAQVFRKFHKNWGIFNYMLQLVQSRYILTQAHLKQMYKISSEHSVYQKHLASIYIINKELKITYVCFFLNVCNLNKEFSNVFVNLLVELFNYCCFFINFLVNKIT